MGSSMAKQWLHQLTRKSRVLRRRGPTPQNLQKALTRFPVFRSRGAGLRPDGGIRHRAVAGGPAGGGGADQTTSSPPSTRITLPVIHWV